MIRFTEKAVTRAFGQRQDTFPRSCVITDSCAKKFGLCLSSRSHIGDTAINVRIKVEGEHRKYTVKLKAEVKSHQLWEVWLWHPFKCCPSLCPGLMWHPIKLNLWPCFSLYIKPIIGIRVSAFSALVSWEAYPYGLHSGSFSHWHWRSSVPHIHPSFILTSGVHPPRLQPPVESRDMPSPIPLCSCFTATFHGCLGSQ